jgi:hypothetical protein
MINIIDRVKRRSILGTKRIYISRIEFIRVIN